MNHHNPPAGAIDRGSDRDQRYDCRFADRRPNASFGADRDDQQDSRKNADQFRLAVQRDAAHCARIASAKSPRIVPKIVPRPPKIEVPPSTTAVIAINS